MDKKLLLERLNKEFRYSTYDSATNGLIVDSSNEITHIGLAVNTSFEVIRQAIQQGVNFLIVHHPPFASEDIDNRQIKIKMLLKNHINLFALHEALDCHSTLGTSSVLAQKLDFKIKETFTDKKNLPVGVIAVKSSDILTRIKKILRDFTIYRNNPAIKTIAVVSGYNGKPFIIHQAKKHGCDTVITGEAHMFGKLYAKENKINLICISHYQSEFYAIARLARYLKDKIPVRASIIKEESLG